jgi:anthranilate phosphoribosyltransferase
MRDVVLLNAGAALFLAGSASSVKGGIDAAAAAIDSGAAEATLAGLVQHSQAAAKELA